MERIPKNATCEQAMDLIQEFMADWLIDPEDRVVTLCLGNRKMDEDPYGCALWHAGASSMVATAVVATMHNLPQEIKNEVAHLLEYHDPAGFTVEAEDQSSRTMEEFHAQFHSDNADFDKMADVTFDDETDINDF